MKLHYPRGTTGQRVLRQTQTCTAKRHGVTNCTTTYTFSGRAAARAERVIGLAAVHGRTAEVGHGTIEHRTLRLSLHRLPKGRYHVSLLKSRASHVYVQVGRVWIRVP